MKAKLFAVDPGVAGQKLVVDRFPTTIGRSRDADLRVDDRWISRIHCEISDLEGSLVVRDLESTNGTLVNGHRVREALLLPGDRLTVGISSFEVRYNRSAKGRLGCAAVSSEKVPPPRRKPAPCNRR